MTYLGLVTGLRPSSLRPLRRRGTEADVLWEEGQLRVRRSQTLGNEVMNTTKQKRKYTIPLPPHVMEVLRWHVTSQLTTPEQEQSDLLFPSVTGGFRSPSVLNKPFADIADEIGLGKRFTQCGPRRTFNDLARVAQVNDVVTGVSPGTSPRACRTTTRRRRRKRNGKASRASSSWPAIGLLSPRRWSRGVLPGSEVVPQVVLRPRRVVLLTKKPTRSGPQSAAFLSFSSSGRRVPKPASPKAGLSRATP